MQTLEEICNKYNLDIKAFNGTPLNFIDVLKEIYYNFSMKELQNLMTDIMELEVMQGENIFKYD